MYRVLKNFIIIYLFISIAFPQNLKSSDLTSFLEELETIINYNEKAEIEKIILKMSKIYNISPSFIKAVIRTESNFEPNSVSCKGAKGLMQLMDNTAFIYGVTSDDIFNIRTNIEAGCMHIDYLLKKYNDPKLALIAYNAGGKWANRYKHDNKIILPNETKLYLERVLKFFNLYNNKDNN